MATYKIVEDDKGKFWIGKVSKTRVVLMEGTWGRLDTLPVHSCDDVVYLKDLREQGLKICNIHGQLFES